jgi:hypothetical protein
MVSDQINNAQYSNIVNTSGGELKQNPVYPLFLPEQEVQKVIFDHDYLSYIERKRKVKNDPDAQNNNNIQ